MTDWRYGDAGDLYPMERGEVWRIGHAVFAVGDLEEGDAPRLIKFCEKHLGVPTAFYSDPPWDKGNARSFRTKAFGKERSREVDFLGSLLPRVVECAQLVEGPFGIEMGRRHADDLIEELRRQGAKRIEVADITYYGHHPCVLVLGTFADDDVLPHHELFHGKDDERTPTLFMESIPQEDVVFDCCVGQGLTCVAASRLGRSSIGMELNPRRAACGIQVIVKESEYDPELLGNFL